MSAFSRKKNSMIRRTGLKKKKQKKKKEINWAVDQPPSTVCSSLTPVPFANMPMQFWKIMHETVDRVRWSRSFDWCAFACYCCYLVCYCWWVAYLVVDYSRDWHPAVGHCWRLSSSFGHVSNGTNLEIFRFVIFSPLHFHGLHDNDVQLCCTSFGFAFARVCVCVKC